MNTDKSHLYHTEKQSRNSEVITDVIIGISDGLSVPFALAAGLSVIVASTSTILIAGISAVAAGAIAMGLGGYYTSRSEMNHDGDEVKTDNIISDPALQEEKNEAKNFFARLGLSEDVQEQAAVEVIKDKEAWANVMLQYDQSKQKHPSNRLVKSGLTIAASYIIGGLIPLLPYSFINHPSTALMYSAAIAIVSLLFFGWIKSKLTGTNRWSGALREAIIGALAGGAAFMVATIFKG